MAVETGLLDDGEIGRLLGHDWLAGLDGLGLFGQSLLGTLETVGFANPGGHEVAGCFGLIQRTLLGGVVYLGDVFLHALVEGQLALCLVGGGGDEVLLGRTLLHVLHDGLVDDTHVFRV